MANGLTPSDRTEVHIAEAGAPYVILRGPVEAPDVLSACGQALLESVD